MMPFHGFDRLAVGSPAVSACAIRRPSPTSSACRCRPRCRAAAPWHEAPIDEIGSRREALGTDLDVVGDSVRDEHGDRLFERGEAGRLIVVGERGRGTVSIGTHQMFPAPGV